MRTTPRPSAFARPNQGTRREQPKRRWQGNADLFDKDCDEQNGRTVMDKKFNG